MKISIPRAIFSVILAASTNHVLASNCQVEGTAFIPFLDPSAGVAEPAPTIGAWDNSEILDYPGASLAGQYGGANGSDRLYSGPAVNGGILFGPYKSFTGISAFGMSSNVEFSTNWRPDGYEYCSKHKTKWDQSRVCVEKSIAYYDTSFIIDISHRSNGVLGTPIYSKQFKNVNSFNRGKIYLPNIYCTGDVSDLEIRIHSLTGGSVDFSIHNVHIDARWRY